jgi:NAD(P) transhydrogenase subunit alpha
MAVAFIPKEAHVEETRVAGTPDTVKALIKAGLQVQVEAGAGLAAGYPDQDYTDAGAEIVADGATARAQADLSIAIRPPEDASNFKRGGILVCGLQPLLQLPLVQSLASAGVTVFAMDLMPRITRAQKMDILSSQATAAGYQAVLMAAVQLPRLFPLLMTAAGTIKPARVFVLGAGVAGLQAIATAKRLGAVVEANDIRPAVKEQVESLGGKFVDTGTPPQAESSGGYAKETSDEYQRKQREILTEHIANSDVVITTALIPGRKAPTLVTEEMLQGMSQGSVVVDMAVEMGGNVIGSEAGKTIEKNGVTIIGELNLPGMVPYDSSMMFAKNVMGFLEAVIQEEGVLAPDWEDEVVSATAVCKDGEVCHPASVEALSSKGGES